MADTLLNNLRRSIGLRPATNTPPGKPDVAAAVAPAARLLLLQRLMADQQRQVRQQTSMLADDSSATLLQLLRSGVDAGQTALLDHAIANLHAMQLHQHHSSDIGSAGFSLSALLDQVCLLNAAQARQQGTELHPLVYDDLPDHFHGDAEPLRALLALLCANAMQGMESGVIIIRAMLDDSPTEDGSKNGQEIGPGFGVAEQAGDAELAADIRICVSLQRDCATTRVPWRETPSNCDALLSFLNAQLSHSAEDDEQRLVITLRANHHYAGNALPNPLDARVVSVFHPCAAARHSLNYRLHRMNLHAMPVERVGDVNGEHCVALLLALPSGYDAGLALAVAASLPVPVPPSQLVVLSDSPPPTELDRRVRWLAAGIDDRRLYQQLLHVLREAESIANPGTNPVAAPVVNEPRPTEEHAGSELPPSLQQLFLAEFPQTLSALRACHQHHDRSALKSLSHKLKGGAAYCDLPALYQVARRLDQAAPAAPAATIDYLLQRLEIEAANAHRSGTAMEN